MMKYRECCLKTKKITRQRKGVSKKKSFKIIFLSSTAATIISRVKRTAKKLVKKKQEPKRERAADQSRGIKHTFYFVIIIDNKNKNSSKRCDDPIYLERSLGEMVL